MALEYVDNFGPVDPNLIKWPDKDGVYRTLKERRDTESIRSMEEGNMNMRLKPYYAAPDPEPEVKLKEVFQRNDSQLEKLIEEFVKNREKELDKSEEEK